MAVASLIVLCITVLASLRLVSSSSAFCPTESNLYLYGLQSQCPGWISPNPPLQVILFLGLMQKCWWYFVFEVIES
ncbi:hypothetical protein CJ030_MR2G012827 [Morella rubra]|uniref:Secreted protein n=1 Tax=Morella rubra TaxID=262757 RepID=A0A6A1W7D1_9ROSI|nr:hypothetical protein CJ030_MR2G012827 [Morella rubra]